MASDETWKKLKYFKPTENWGKPDVISDDLLLLLDSFRHYIGLPFFITAGVKTDGHKPKSFHYEQNGACAVDFVIPEFSGHAMDLMLDVFRFPFSGVGYYNFWKYKGKVVHGLHLDTRPVAFHTEHNFTFNRWIGVERKGKTVYLAMDYFNLKEYGVER